MATIVTRAGKGSALTFVEGDANFTNLNTDKIELTDLSVGTPASASGSGSISYDNATGVFTYTPPEIPTSGIGSLNDDTTPQLSGNLDVNDFEITTSVTDGNIVIAPNGVGVVELGGDTVNGYDGAVVIKPNVSDGNGVLATETGIDMVIVTDAGSGDGAYVTFAAAGGVEIVSNGATTIDGIIYPNEDGTAGQVIVTDGEGNLSFSTLPSAGISNVVEDTTPQLGGNLDVDEYKITTTSSTVPLTIEAYQDAGYSFDIGTNTLTGSAPVININGILAVDDSLGLGINGITTQSDSIGLYLGVNLLDATKPSIVLDNSGSISIFVEGADVPFIEIAAVDGSVQIQGLLYPNADGTVGQVLTTDGEGNLTFEDAAAGGIASVEDDTTPVLGGDLDGQGNTISDVNLENYKETVYSIGTTSGTVAPDVANGNVQTITLDGNLTLNAFTSPVAGQSLTLIIDTNGTGRTLTSSMKFAGASKTLSTTDTTDIISVFYDGTNYWASLGKGFA